MFCDALQEIQRTRFLRQEHASAWSDQTLSCQLCTWMCKKQGAVSHSSTESEIIALAAAPRMEGLPCLGFGDIVVNVLNNIEKKTKTKTTKKDDITWEDEIMFDFTDDAYSASRKRRIEEERKQCQLTESYNFSNEESSSMRGRSAKRQADDNEQDSRANQREETPEKKPRKERNVTPEKISSETSSSPRSREEDRRLYE